jgi:proteasome accessory factor A
MTRLIDRSGVSWDDPRVALLDLQYHDMRPDRSVYHRLAALGIAERITNDAAIELAMTTPPQTTRARLRGECIRRLRLGGKDYRADWGSVKVFGEDAPTPSTIHWRDPLQAHDADTEHLMEQL